MSPSPQNNLRLLSSASGASSAKAKSITTNVLDALGDKKCIATYLHDDNAYTADALLFYFSAPWCEPCRAMPQPLALIAAQYPTLLILEADAEEQPDACELFDVTAVPTFVVVAKNNKAATGAPLNDEGWAVVSKINGADVKGVADAVKAALGEPNEATTTTHTTTTGKDPLTAKIESLIHGDKVVLFMKGVPDAPRCGFSRRVIEALNGAECSSFAHVDILAEDMQDVREGLKSYSSWPTYPQLYVDGELVGGCDIIEEMASSGELKDTLGKDPLTAKIESLIHGDKVVLFMKGVPDAPRCGFSRRVVAALNGAECSSFAHVDILAEDMQDVREGLKSYSSWPTYPQLYVDGELVGGCDIIEEMASSGELKDTVA
ncbi:monothiol glutaredoxin [Pseudoscourfieldia marina]